MLDEINALCFGGLVDAKNATFVRDVEHLRREGRLAEAERAALDGLEQDPYVADGHDSLARVYAERGDTQRAHDEWDTVLRLDPHHVGALKGLAFLAVRRRDLSSALRFLDASLSAAPDDETARRAHGRVVDLLREAPATINRGDIATAPRGVIAVTPRRTTTTPVAGPRLIAALLIDADGHVVHDLAPVRSPGMSGEALGAVLSVLGADARHTLADIGLGVWESLSAECAEGAIVMSPLSGDHAVIVAADRDVPLGMLRREMGRHRETARAVLGGK
jgi:predicted regulator of Ras-like GTPase activity (Roadblock/LC7/MglB family)